jgi:hypothetical protein
LNALDVDTGFAFTDMIVTPVTLGWHLKNADVTAAYNIYVPTGRFSANGTDNTGLGMVGIEFSLGTTVCLDKKKMWTAASNFALEFHTDKSGTDINVGDMATAARKTLTGKAPSVFPPSCAGPDTSSRVRFQMIFSPASIGTPRCSPPQETRPSKKIC